MTVTSIVVNGFPFSMQSSELRLTCGSSNIFFYNDFQFYLPGLYTIDTTTSIAPPPPIPAADELWVLVRHTMHFNSFFRLQELKVFAEVSRINLL
jgi:hypothetical protein